MDSGDSILTKNPLDPSGQAVGRKHGTSLTPPLPGGATGQPARRAKVGMVRTTGNPIAFLFKPNLLMANSPLKK